MIFAVFDPPPLTYICCFIINLFFCCTFSGNLKSYMVIFNTVRHLGFVWGLFRPPTKSTWWFLSLLKIWLQSMQ